MSPCTLTGSTRKLRSEHLLFISPASVLMVIFHCYWNNEFKLFYDPDTGLDIDGAWIDMNEPSSVSVLRV